MVAYTLCNYVRFKQKTKNIQYELYSMLKRKAGEAELCEVIELMQLHSNNSDGLARLDREKGHRRRCWAKRTTFALRNFYE